MDGKEIREAFERVLEDVQNMTNDGLICNVMDDIIYVNARKALAALSTIDSEAIRRENALRDALDRMYTMVSQPDFPIIPDKYYHHVLNANAILGAEPAQDERNYPEDATHENGNYQRECITCGATFIGHKRRAQCKICASGSAQDMPKCTKPDDTECHAHSGDKCYNGFQCNPAQDDGKAEEYDMASADFEENTITLQVPSDIFKTLGFAPCKIKADLSPLVELGKRRRIEEAGE